MHDSPLLLSIGSISKATGIPANTLRSWERRYGFPTPERSAGGQRVYKATLIPHLKLIAEAVGQGHRIGKVIHASSQELAALVSTTIAAPVTDLRGDEVALRWLGAASELDGEALRSGLRTEYARRGALGFLIDCVSPFLALIGEAWVRDEIGVHHEHFASETLRTFLATLWDDLGRGNPGPPLVCATLPDERHDLGLHMAACVAALAGCRIVWLGADSPVDTIAATARSAAATGVLLSVSTHADPEQVGAHLEALLDRVRQGTTVWVGGGGAAAEHDRIRVVRDLRALYEDLSG